MSPPSSPRSAICSGFSLCAIAGANASSVEKMNSVLAAPRRISDLLSSVPGPNVKKRKRAMDQPRTDEDQQLVARTQDGDAGAFDQLVVKYTPRLYGLVYNMTSNHEDTNDLLQDIFSKAYKSIRGFRGKSSFYTWIHSIAVNMTLNFLKKRGRRFHLSLDDVDASIQNDKEFLELTQTSSPVREADLSELQRRLNEAMMKLSDEHRAVVTMFHIQGMPHAEISKILNVSEGTVRSRLFYANRQLQNYLDEFRKNPVT
jgi:RNA polymerase sigma factor (sigma-70 family)